MPPVSDQPSDPLPDDFEERLALALGEAHRRMAAEGRWAAIQSWNEWVASNGVSLEEYLWRIDRRGRDEQ